MFRMRRYRIFLLIAILSAASVFYLINIRHTTLSDVDKLRQFTFGRSPGRQQSTLEQHRPPPKHEADSPPKLSEPPPPDPELELPPSPVTISSIAPQSTLDDFTGHSPTSTAAEEAETITGEELLSGKSDKESDFKLVNGNEKEAQRILGIIPQPTWQPQKEHNPVPKDKLIRLPKGRPKSLPQVQYDFPKETNAEKADRLKKLVAVREAFKHAWDGYKKFAMPHDELLPVTRTYSDSFMGWGATLIDSLDTLWIMDLKEDFERAVNETRLINFKTSHRKEIPMFETVIRLLGGLISAHDLSKGQYPILLEKAIELADVLMGAFDTPNRMPDMYYKWAPSYASQQHRAGTNVVLAELGSMSMEFTRLAQLTKEDRYYDAIARVQDALEEWQMKTEVPGLWPLVLDASGCKKGEPSKFPSNGRDDKKNPMLIGSEHVNDGGIVKGETSTRPDRPDGNLRPKLKRQADDLAPIPRVGGDQSTDTPHSNSLVDEADGFLTTASEANDQHCTPQGLYYEPHAKVHRYAIAAQADSVYEYMPKMHRLLGGLSPQYESMYRNAAVPMRGKIFYRAMIEDSKRTVLFPAEHDFDSSLKVKAKRMKSVWEATHLGCFAGGMFGLAAKTFGISSDMRIAEQLTDGCVWAYESTTTKIMPEKAALIPCDDPTSCPWDDDKWYKALDPKLKERMDAVDTWNKQQKKLYKQTGMNVAKEPTALKPLSRPKPTVLKGASVKGAVPKKSDILKKRDPPVHETPTSTDGYGEDADESPLGQFGFVPKVAMSHERYVKARIQEERLPRGYTKIYDRSYILRPEAIESVFLMWRMTGEDVWRQKGWNMFQAVQEATHVAAGNAGLEDVTSIIGEKKDKMESFWLAETLKYFYLLFSEPSVVSLDDYVFNTEAHPFSVPKP